MKVEWSEIAAYVDDVKKVSQTVEEVWPDDAPEDVEEAIMDALEALDRLQQVMEGYLDD